MFMLADVCFYLALLSVIGPKALTVTTSAYISFMRKPSAAPLLATARRLKLGKSLAVGDVLLFSEGMEAPVAHASMTYAIPPATPLSVS
jgi:acyl-coenzyme A thioesterase PaaI-like protein